MNNFRFGSFCLKVRQLLRKKQHHDVPLLKRIDESVFFSSPLNLDATPGDVCSLHTDPMSEYQMEVSTPALTGAYGSLPSAYTEWLAEQYLRHGDLAAKSFLDIFNHRICSFYYLSWLKNRCYVEFEQTSDSVVHRILSHVLHLPAQSSFQGVRTGGYFNSPSHSLVQLEKLLTLCCQHPVTVQPFTGTWVSLPVNLRAQLGSMALSLTEAPALGEQYWDRAGHFTVTVGPLSSEQLSCLTKNNSFLTTLTNQVREYIGPVLAFNIEFHIRSPKEALTLLGKSKLGYDTFLGKKEMIYTLRLPDNTQEYDFV